ncbi:uncharacterized protein LOC129000269 [Macrosteles quadrilineatus]|uniref:uncharacterized protein LOC129000269 n=1 Tax=Macrosteles quadrilineatus TaxID=74068 RepID=UPI0023E2ADB8|nr:uncharacterized protein LOC129000269 [Macrosteles quadrilineatus]
MTNCGACKKLIVGENETIKCGKCIKTFHLGCTPIQSEANIAQLGVRTETWECPKCTSQSEETVESFVDEVVTRSVIEDILGEMKTSSTQKIEAVTKELDVMKKSVMYLSRQVDEYKNTVQLVEEEMGRLQTENSRLQTKNGNMWRTVIRLGDDVTELQQLRWREASGGVQAAREVVDEVGSPKAALALCLSFLSVAGILGFIASRVFKRAMKIITNEQEKQNSTFLF